MRSQTLFAALALVFTVTGLTFAQSVSSTYSAREVLGEQWFQQAVTDYRALQNELAGAQQAYRHYYDQYQRTGDDRLLSHIAKIGGDIRYFQRTLYEIEVMLRQKKKVVLVSHGQAGMPTLNNFESVVDHLRRNPHVFHQGGTYTIAQSTATPQATPKKPVARTAPRSTSRPTKSGTLSDQRGGFGGFGQDVLDVLDRKSKRN